MARVAAKIDCEACDTTGYQNYYRITPILGYYKPGAIKRWNLQQGQAVFSGDGSVKFDTRYRELLNRATQIAFNGVQWNFAVLRDPGAALGQERIVVAVSRKD